jgi:cyclophilin family peptidyl-prolyl cis-trans isomerase
MSNPHVLIETSEGEMLAELFEKEAPLSVANFLRYADAGHYDNTIFHRIVRGFVIQGGGYDRDLVKKPPHAPIANESTNGLSNAHGTLAMARAPEKDSACDEFFINAADNAELDHQDESDEGYGYAVFGRVVEGLNIVKKINWKLVKPRNGFDELPVDTVTIFSVRRFD